MDRVKKKRAHTHANKHHTPTTVHEKSLLFALAPLCPLLHTQGDHALAAFVAQLGAFSMFPLLRRDGLAGAYCGCLLLHG